MLRRTDGTPVPASITSRGVIFDGEPALVTSSVDLTDLRAAQVEAARSREALHQSEKMTALGSLLAGVAHELNNPLSVVVGYSSMLRDLVEDEATRTRVERIHEAAERCARIVRTFLAMARARPPQRGPVQLCDVVTDAIEIAGYGLRSADIEVRTDVSADLPPVWGDADQLHQVVVNLVVNAQQALLGRPAPAPAVARRPGRGRHGRARGRRQRAGHDRRRRQAHLRAVLHHQAAGRRHRRRPVDLPWHRHDARRPHRAADRPRPRRALHGRAAGGREGAADETAASPPPARVSGRVLVIDDEPDIAALLADRLGRDGFTVSTATSGRRALDLAARQPFDAAVTDLRMPDMDGAALAEALAARRPGPARAHPRGDRRRAGRRPRRPARRRRPAGVRKAARPRRAQPRTRPPHRRGSGERDVSPAARLIVVDDEAGLRALLEDYLGMQGFAVRTADSVASLEAALADAPAELILLDVNMPGEDGLAALARLRAAGLETAVILLTAQDAPDSRITGLLRGADDYVVKPFEPRELLARIRAVLRRMPPPAAAAPRELVSFGDFRLDLAARRLTDAHGAEIDISAMEHDLLAVFARHPRQTLSRERLAELAHGRRLEPGDRSVDIRMRRLRQKIERDPSAPRVLRTVHGEGYRFDPDG